MLSAGERLERLKTAGAAVEQVSATYSEGVNTWAYLPAEAVADPTFQTLIESFDIETPVVSIPNISKAQALLWLLSIGKFEADVIAAVNTIPDPMSRQVALIEWNYKQPFVRSDPLFDSLGAALGLTPLQLDAAFIAASVL